MTLLVSQELADTPVLSLQMPADAQKTSQMISENSSVREILIDCIIFNKFPMGSGMVCDENLSGTIQFFAEIRNFETFSIIYCQ